MKKILVIGFRRSGNHLLKETMNANFDVKFHHFGMGHPQPDLHGIVLLRRFLDLIYIYRDGRDVMCSLHNFCLKSGFQNWDGTNIIIPDNLSDFIHGKTIINRCWCPGMQRMFENPVRSWVENTRLLNPITHKSCRGEKIFSIRFEDLVRRPEKIILQIGEYLNKPLKHSEPKPIVKLVGPATRKGQIDKWKEEFTKKDKEYFWQNAGRRMLELGYKK